MGKAIKNEKKIECIIGIFLLIPPILEVLSFLDCLVQDAYGSGAGCSSSPAPSYLGLMALAGAYLIKNSFRYFFVSEPKKEEENQLKE